MKRLMVLVVVVYFLAIAVTAQAQEPQNLQYYGDKTVTFAPSASQEAIGHVIYFSDGTTEHKKRLDLPVVEWTIPEGLLYPGVTYTFTATAFDAAMRESARSEPLVVYIEPLPEIVDNLPDIYQPVSAPQTITIGEI